MDVSALGLAQGPGRSGWTAAGLARLIGLAAAAGLLLGALGPFGTYGTMQPIERLLFWELVLTSAAAVHIPALWLAERVGRRLRAPTAAWILAAAVLAAIPTMLLVTGLIALLYGYSDRPKFLEMFGFVMLIGGPMQGASYALLRWSADRKKDAPTAAPVGKSEDPAPGSAGARALLDRLPARLGSSVLCLEMQDHYVRVHTDRGAAMVLMRMADAVEAMSGVDGRQVHRSWWVARAAVAKAVRDGRTATLSLVNGLTVPVSRERRAELLRQGWLGDAPRGRG